MDRAAAVAGGAPQRIRPHVPLAKRPRGGTATRSFVQPCLLGTSSLPAARRLALAAARWAPLRVSFGSVVIADRIVLDRDQPLSRLPAGALRDGSAAGWRASFSAMGERCSGRSPSLAQGRWSLPGDLDRARTGQAALDALQPGYWRSCTTTTIRAATATGDRQRFWLGMASVVAPAQDQGSHGRVARAGRPRRAGPVVLPPAEPTGRRLKIMRFAGQGRQRTRCGDPAPGQARPARIRPATSKVLHHLDRSFWAAGRAAKADALPRTAAWRGAWRR
jgi:hypothetical protein